MPMPPHRSEHPARVPDVALPRGADPVVRHRALHRLREEFLDGGGTTPEPGRRATTASRQVVVDSWRRCLEAGWRPESPPPPADLDTPALEARRALHPLAQVMHVVRQVLVDDAADAGLVVAVCDAEGRLLWVEGCRRMRDRAARMHFVPGSLWSEARAGSNAPGTALATGRAVQYFGAEHLAPAVTPWSCTAVPVHDPATGALLGAIDVTGGDDAAAPQTLPLLRAVAAAAEAELRLRALPRAPRPAPAPRPGHRPGARLQVLGVDRARLVATGVQMVLTLRHSEILLALARSSHGMSGAGLAVALHESDPAAVTLRAEVSRLRRQLAAAGLPGLESRPYRLDGDVTTDLGTVLDLLARGRVTEAWRACPGPVLPASQAPHVVAERETLQAQLRAALLASGQGDLVWEYLQRPEHADDFEAWQVLLKVLPRNAWRRPLAEARLQLLDRNLAATSPCLG